MFIPAISKRLIAIFKTPLILQCRTSNQFLDQSDTIYQSILVIFYSQIITDHKRCFKGIIGFQCDSTTTLWMQTYRRDAEGFDCLWVVWVGWLPGFTCGGALMAS